jgi:Wiskott-Aldrich syndrome protein
VPLPAATGNADNIFKPDGRATIPPPPGLPTGTTGGTPLAPMVVSPGAPNPDEIFKPDGRATLPPPRPNGPVWGPSGPPAPPPLPPVTNGPAGGEAPRPMPSVPPTLPPLPGTP